jgi:murein DD-endopeptidase MepM/ murein hydrolase activator NlpD
MRNASTLVLVLFSLCACASDPEQTFVTVLSDAGTPVPSDVDASMPVVPPADARPRCTYARITAAQSLNVRAAPTTTAMTIGQVLKDQIVEVRAEVTGEDVSGNSTWFEVPFEGKTGYITATFAQCTTQTPPTSTFPATVFLLPIECNKTVRIAQGNNSDFSHTGRTQYAFDFAIGLNTPLLAMQDGVVLDVFDRTKPGDRCYAGGGSSCFPFANYVLLKHADGSASIYKHLNRVDVRVGALVARGAVVGLSGSTGYSTGPHAHVMRQEVCVVANCQSLPLAFADVAGSGVPATGNNVTSQNCKL